MMTRQVRPQAVQEIKGKTFKKDRQTWCFICLQIPALGGLRQKDLELQATLGYLAVPKSNQTNKKSKGKKIKKE